MNVNSKWEHVRGILIASHILAIILMALPSPQGGMRRSAWANETVQAEFAAWTVRLDQLGYSTTQEELEENLWELANRVTSIRRTVLTPIEPYAKYMGTQQSWRMFVAPHRYPARLHVEIKYSDSDWETISIFGDSDANWMDTAFENDRFRSALFRYGWASYGHARGRFNQWLAQKAAHDFPDASHLRTRWFRYQTPSPEQVLSRAEVEGEFILQSRSFQLADYREES